MIIILITNVQQYNEIQLCEEWPINDHDNGWTMTSPFIIIENDQTWMKAIIVKEIMVMTNIEIMTENGPLIDNDDYVDQWRKAEKWWRTNDSWPDELLLKSWQQYDW